MMTHLENTSRTGAIERLWAGLRGGKALGDLVLRSVNLQHGEVESLVPDSYTPTEVQEFEKGHTFGSGEGRSVTIGRIAGFASRKPNVREELAELIYRLLDADSLCLLENPLATVGDSWLDHAKSHVAIYEAEVYHFLTSADRDIGAIAQAIRESHHPPLSWGAIGRTPINWPTNTGQVVITTEELERFAETVRCVFISAYDDEGYLVWRIVERERTGNSAPGNGEQPTLSD
jgi:hypothetical protein